MAPSRSGERSRPWPGSRNGVRIGERLVALFFFGLVAFSPLVIGIFDQGAATTVLGLPVLYFYLFAAWGTLIALLARVMEGRRDRPMRPADPARTPRDRESIQP